MYPEFTVLGMTIESYPLMYLLGAAAALTVVLLLSRRYGLKAPNSLLLFVSALASGFVGSALAYMCVTYPPAETLEQLKSGHINTGFVFYGGLISGAAFTYLILRLLKLDARAYTRALLPALPLGHAIGRVGCYLSGCCYGRFCEALGARIPVQLIESGALLIIFVILLRMSLKDQNRLVLKYILMYAPLRFLLEFLRGDDIRGYFLCFSTSQWVSMGLILLCAVWYGIRRHTHQ